MEIQSGENGKTAVANTVSASEPKALPLNDNPSAHGAPEIVDYNGNHTYNGGVTAEDIDESKEGWFAYIKTKDFYVVLLLGLVGSCCLD